MNSLFFFLLFPSLVFNLHIVLSDCNLFNSYIVNETKIKLSFFSDSILLKTGSEPYNLASEDLNNDSLEDIVIANTGQHIISVFFSIVITLRTTTTIVFEIKRFI